MRNKISGLIGMLWGGGIVVSRLVSESPASGAYQAGQMAALVFGLVLLGAGLYYFFKKP